MTNKLSAAACELGYTSPVMRSESPRLLVREKCWMSTQINIHTGLMRGEWPACRLRGGRQASTLAHLTHVCFVELPMNPPVWPEQRRQSRKYTSTVTTEQLHKTRGVWDCTKVSVLFFGTEKRLWYSLLCSHPCNFFYSEPFFHLLLLFCFPSLLIFLLFPLLKILSNWLMFLLTPSCHCLVPLHLFFLSL